MTAQPYVGITGPVSMDEVVSLTQAFSDSGYTMHSPHIPMLGFLVSLKTLHDQGTANRRYVTFSKLRTILEQASDKVLTMIHYNSREMATLAVQVAEVFDGLYQDGLCRSLQLNVAWPDVEQVRLIKKQFPDLNVVLQLSQSVMEGRTVDEIAGAVLRYENYCSYALIDPSGGRGKEFDVGESVNLYNQLRSMSLNLTLGFAGGFTGQNVEQRVQQIVKEVGTAEFCIDAEGGLRDKRSDVYGDDALNMEKVKEYLRAAARVLP
ncbi:hypothetical protein HY490_05245 [Candidatus Woesearchaeota archaeon]|nr:hypothetical protein [Candidatus Woesearchaeota archaeon]